MMTAPHPIALRERVVKYAKSGKATRKEVCKIFCISHNTLNDWLNLDKAGSLAPKKIGGNNRKLDEKKLKKMAEENADILQSEAGKALGVHQTSIGRAFTRMGITRKKNHSIHRKGRKKARRV